MKLGKPFLILAVMLAPLMFSSAVTAQFDPLNDTCEQIGNNGQNSEICNEVDNDENNITGTDGVLLRVADVLAIVAAVIAVIVIVVAGITMMTSGGDSTKVQNSRNAIIYAAVGLVVIVLARSIVIFVINQTG